MGIISVEQADRLYWLGRYTERVSTTIRLFSKSFDYMIDGISDSYDEFCKMIDIPNVYASSEDFNRNYPFDAENPNSIISNLTRAYDNAIVLRESIGSETLSYIQLSIYEMQKAKVSESPLIELQKVLDDLLAFWGVADDLIDDERVRNIIKAGKRIERIDIYARLGAGGKELIREVNRMIPRVEKSGLNYDVDRLIKIKEMANSSEVDFYGLVSEVESIF
ncbi:MAG: alpha-E domain-containing protein [Spirochaetales bacterium]|nr:alpha-E domain-containing protein [Spirochaetales bacterium]